MLTFTAPKRMQKIKNWQSLSLYERFEQIIAVTVSAVIMVVVLISLFQLIRSVFVFLFLEAFNPLDHRVFSRSSA